MSVGEDINAFFTICQYFPLRLMYFFDKILMLMKTKINQKQQEELQKLEKWFDLELIKLKKKRIEILKRYDKKRSLLFQNKILKHISGIKTETY